MFPRPSFRISFLCSALLATAFTARAAAIDVDVIYTKIGGHPTAVIPGTLDLAGQPAATEWRAMEDLVVSGDGTRWVIRGRTQLGSDLETILVMGSGTSGTMFAQEGQPIPTGAPGELFDFFGSGLGDFDSTNRLAYTARARGGVAAVFQKVIYWDGTNQTIVHQMGDLYSGLIDLPPNPSGDETVGNSVGSAHLLDDGRIGLQDSTILVIHTSRRPAIFYDLAAFHQTGVTTVTGLGGGPAVTWGTIDANTFYTSPNGMHWVAHGTILGAPTASNNIMVYDGEVRIQEGNVIPGSGVTASTILNTQILHDGTWLTRGAATVPAGPYAVRNGVVVAKAGDPITTGSSENWSTATFLAFNGNTNGDWVIIGTTDNGDPATDTVMVLNGDQVLLREGDPVDVDGNGMFDDDAFIGRGNNTLAAFIADTLYINNSRVLHVLANLRNGAGQDLNSTVPVFGTPNAFLRITVPAACNPCDVNCDTIVDINDIDDFAAVLVGNAAPCSSCAADTDGNSMHDGFDIKGFVDCLLGP